MIRQYYNLLKFYTAYVETFEWVNLQKKSAVSNFKNSILKNGTRVYLAVIVLSHFKTLSSKTAFKNFYVYGIIPYFVYLETLELKTCPYSMCNNYRGHKN